MKLLTLSRRQSQSMEAVAQDHQLCKKGFPEDAGESCRSEDMQEDRVPLTPHPTNRKFHACQRPSPCKMDEEVESPDPSLDHCDSPGFQRSKKARRARQSEKSRKKGTPKVFPPEQEGEKKLRYPTCALCSNHSLILPLKDHKRHCLYQKCGCPLCLVVHERRAIMARQVAVRRAHVQDEKRAKEIDLLRKKGLILPEPAPLKVLLPDTESSATELSPKQNVQDDEKPSAFRSTGAGGISAEEQARAEGGISCLKQAFGTSPQSCTLAYMALLKCVAYNIKEAYEKMLEAEVLKDQYETTKFESGIPPPTEHPALPYYHAGEHRENTAPPSAIFRHSSPDLVCNGAQTNVRTMGMPLRVPVTVPTTSPSYPPTFPSSFMASSPPAPVLYSPYNCSNWPYWATPYFPNSAAAGAPPVANGTTHHLDGALPTPLYSFAVTAAPPQSRVSEVLSSENSRGSAEYGSRDDGSDKEGQGRAPSQGRIESPTPLRSPRPKMTRFMPYKRSSDSPCKDVRV